jgi:hypothetical protein
MTELLLVQPPYWSPFQPPLALAALSAWLRSAGRTVHSIDLNLAFFDWLLSDECAHLLDQAAPASADRAADRALLASASGLREAIAALHATDHSRPLTTTEVRRSFLVSRWLEAHLAAVSRLDGGFSLSLRTGLRWRGGLSPEAVARVVEHPSPAIAAFLHRALSRVLEPGPPAAFGLSCLGQEQLAFTLMLGTRLKAVAAAPVIVGGSYLPRLLHSGALPAEWLGRAFDLVVRGQGEIPSEMLLDNLDRGRSLAEGVPGVIVPCGGGIAVTPAAEPLEPTALPVPDFDDLLPGDYLAPSPRLPLLASQGCYWGRCEFCSFARSSSARHRPHPVDQILHRLRTLTARYGVRHFEFGDEAIPPATLRAMARTFPDSADSGWVFSSMIRFEQCLDREDYEDLHRIGFRILKLGLESASPRVRALMGKQVDQSTIRRTLDDTAAAGLWSHVLLFFGFPGELDEDAAATLDFIRDHHAVIGSVGAGVFSLEHDARMNSHLGDFGVRVRPRREVSLIHDYEVAEGIGPERALDWLGRLVECLSRVPSYREAGRLLPELGLDLLTATPGRRLVEMAREVCMSGPGQGALRLFDVQVLDPLSAMRFLSLVSARGRDMLRAATADGAIAAVGAWWRGTPVGVCVALVDGYRATRRHTGLGPGPPGSDLERLLHRRLEAEVGRRQEARRVHTATVAGLPGSATMPRARPDCDSAVHL